MSYKTTILSDYPLSYYPLDDLTTGDVPDFNDLLSQFDTYQDVLDYYDSYANMTGTTAYDYSGCNNYGIYSGAPTPNILPIVPGNSMATKITNLEYVTYNIVNDYTGSLYDDHFGTKYSSDADFTIEAWFYPKIVSTDLTPIVADATNNIGLFYENGNVTFKIDSQELTYTLPDLDRVFHIAGVYLVNSAQIYVNGQLATSLSLTEFEFTNEECNLKSGPTSVGDYFLLNSVATYRYALSSDQILGHYNAAYGTAPIQIITPEDGEIFQISDRSPSLIFNYSYPGNKSWSYFSTEDLSYNAFEESISIAYDSAGGSKTVVLEDYISIPVSATMDSSKIEWTATSGVTIETSIDGITYTECENATAIEGYRIDDFSSNAQVYLRITLDTSDMSKFLPKIYDLTINFYNNEILYANNGADYITTQEETSGLYNYDIILGNNYSEILWRSGRNGIKTFQNSGFYLNTSREINTIEFFYTPFSLSDDSGLIETQDGEYNASVYRWNNTGNITKSGITAIYVNGVNKTSETHIENVFNEGDLHHVIIVYNSAVSGQFTFSETSYGSVTDLFQNITLYPAQFTADQAWNQYSLYTRKSYEIVNAADSSSINMTENSVNYYNNDWKVIQTA